jgi:multidrug transporter EmrE-like cation transporter
MFSNPYIRIGFVLLTSTASEMLLKLGAKSTAALPQWVSWLGFSALHSGWVWWGMLLQVIGFVAYAAALRVLPLSTAFGIMSALHATIPICARIFFHEDISLQRWAGIGLVLAGVLLLARPASQVEEKT